MSKQGQLLGEHYFPTPCNSSIDGPIVFKSYSRYLIDFGSAFLVLLIEENTRKRLFRLVVPRHSLVIDLHLWNKERCANELQEILNQYPSADLVFVNFPFFNKLNNNINNKNTSDDFDQCSETKTRPSLALYFYNNKIIIYIIIIKIIIIIMKKKIIMKIII